MFLPSPSDLLANLSNCREQVVNMLTGENVRLLFISYCQIVRLCFLLHCQIGSKTKFKLLYYNFIRQIYPSFSTAVRKQRTASVQPFRPPTKWWNCPSFVGGRVNFTNIIYWSSWSCPAIIFHPCDQVNPTGGRITVVQGSLPNIGPGAVENREGGGGDKVWICFKISFISTTYSSSPSFLDPNGHGEASEPVDGLLQAARLGVQWAADRRRPLRHRQVNL